MHQTGPVYMHAHTCIPTHVYPHMYTHPCISTHAYPRICTCTHVYPHMHTHPCISTLHVAHAQERHPTGRAISMDALSIGVRAIHPSMRTCTCAPVHVHLCRCTCACAPVRVHLCVCTYACAPAHTCMHLYWRVGCACNQYDSSR